MSPDILSLSLSQTKALLVSRALSQMRAPAQRLRSLYLEGHAGIGKTKIIMQAANEIQSALGAQVEVKTLNLQFCERPDFMGLPYINSEQRTSFARPQFLPESGCGLLFLDEANRVDADIRSGLLTLLEDRNINGHALGEGWIIVLAGNPSEQNSDGSYYEVHDFDSALLDRIAKVKVTSQVDHLVSFLCKKYPDHPLLKFLINSPSFISFDGTGITPRTFEYALRATQNLLINDPDFYTQLATEIGPIAAKHIVRTLSSGYYPTINDILSGSEKPLEFIIKHPERQDAILNVVHEIHEWMKNNALKDVSPKVVEVENIISFIMDLKHEHRLSLFEMIRGGPASTYFGQYFLKNNRLAEMLYAKRAASA